MNIERPRTRRPRPFPKGRQIDPDALAEIEALMAGRAPRRDLLIEHLHVVQERFGHLSARHLRALASWMRLSQAEIYEVATFYAHFDVVKEDEAPPPPVTVRVCRSLPCFIAGADRLMAAVAEGVDPADVRVVAAPCVGRCASAPVAVVGEHPVDRASADAVVAVVRSDDRAAPRPAHADLAAYRSAGGYRVLEAVRDGSRSTESVIETLSESGLRGLGGAGFPTGRKWQIVSSFPAPRLMTVNADEGEPGTFKDRFYLESDPHRMLEGMLIAAHVVGVDAVYIYLRDEYPAARDILIAEIAALEQAGLAAPGFIALRRGAGAYICGEESAMIESIEGKRGWPRHRPPFIAERGLFGRPTLNHNVETLHWLRDILEHGAEWFAGQGLRGAKGPRSWSVSGRVRNPGVILAGAGITANELIEAAGGMQDGHALRAFLPGGASGGILPAGLADTPLDFGGLDAHGAFVGSHAFIVLSDQDDIRAAALNLMEFFAEESCGQCTPCRVGTEKAVDLMRRPDWDEPLLHELSAAMADASICGLGQAAPNPLRSLFRFFPEMLR